MKLKQIYPTLEGNGQNFRMKRIEKDETILTDTNFKIAIGNTLSAPTIKLSSFNTKVWDGSLSAKTISLSPKGVITSPVRLNLNNFELGKLIELLKISGLKAKGLFSGYITLSNSEKGLVISDGELNNIDDGFIQYQPDEYPKALQGNDPRMNTVRDALTNFTFNDLQTHISGPLDGDLKVTLNAKGRNEKLFDERPIHLNLSIEGALSPLLKSFLKPLSLKPTLNKSEDKK